jgi:UDP-glucose:(heptosyl)LPS alpha-1,3-glucosyltransferase
VRIAFLLFQYFPHGGLQRDFRAIAEACGRRGHSVSVLTMKWQGAIPSGFSVELIPVRSWTNHGRCLRFVRAVQEPLRRGRFDVVVGFNKMPGLDFYFAADPCYLGKALSQRGWFYRRSSRCRTFVGLEKAVFGPGTATSILVLSEGVKQAYMECWGTPGERFHVLPPGISRDRMAPPDASAIRQVFREEWGIGSQESVVLMVGSGFKTKGLDRALRALAALDEPRRSRTWLMVVGRGQAGSFHRLAARLGVEQRLKLVGGRDDVARFLVGADLLLHPARTETYGMVLLEAMASGLPVLVTEGCGYAGHVRTADAGMVVPEPFEQPKLDELLRQMLGSIADRRWSRNGLEYIARTDVFSLPERAAELIESGVKDNDGRGT